MSGTTSGTKWARPLPPMMPPARKPFTKICRMMAASQSGTHTKTLITGATEKRLPAVASAKKIKGLAGSNSSSSAAGSQTTRSLTLTMRRTRSFTHAIAFRARCGS